MGSRRRKEEKASGLHRRTDTLKYKDWRGRWTTSSLNLIPGRRLFIYAISRESKEKKEKQNKHCPQSRTAAA